MESDFQSTLLGDVLFTVAGTLSISLSTSDPATYAWSETVVAGTWFSSPLHLLLYMVEGWNQANGGGMSVSLVSDPTDTNYRKFAFQPDNGFGVVTAFSFLVPGQFADCGLSSDNYDLGAGSSVKYSPNVAPYVFTPYWPPSQYDRAVDNLTGYSMMGHDGSMYSIGGVSQKRVTLSLALERTSGMDETRLWRNLWRDRWTRGRAVTFYMQRENLPESWDGGPLEADVLELPSSGENLDFTRMMELTELINYTRPTEFVHRTHRLADHEVYNGVTVVEAVAARVTHWYRAGVGATLDMTDFLVPDSEDCRAAVWFRVNSVSGQGTVLTDDAWPGAIVAEEPLSGESTYVVAVDVASEMPVEPGLGQWALLLLSSQGGEVSIEIDGIQAFDAVGGGIDEITGALSFGGAGFGDSIEVDVANIAVWPGGSGWGTPYRQALKAAGVTWDYAKPFGGWPGEEPLLYICGAPDLGDEVVYSSDTAGTTGQLETVTAANSGLLVT